MPYVNVKITRGATTAQKARLVADITRTLVETLGKRPEHTHIVIDEVDPDDWGFAGVLTTEYRRREAERAADPPAAPPRKRGRAGAGRPRRRA